MEPNRKCKQLQQ